MTRTPNEKFLESLSAFVDGEATEIERYRILKHGGGDPDLRGKWQRYHLIGSTLRSERNHLSRFDIAARVSAAIAAEPREDSAAAPVAASQAPAWRDLALKFGVAASVAAVVVLGLARPGQSPEAPQIVSAGVTAPASQPTTPATVVTAAPSGFELPLPEARTVAGGAASYNTTRAPTNPANDLVDPATQALLNRLLMEHAERASANGSLGLLPFARVSQMEASER